MYAMCADALYCAVQRVFPGLKDCKYKHITSSEPLYQVDIVRVGFILDYERGKYADALHR
jgi:hypothetical protein